MLRLSANHITKKRGRVPSFLSGRTSLRRSFIAELKAQNASMGSMIADLRGEFYYLDGTIFAPSSKASISGQTITLGSTCSASGTTINLA